MNGNGLSFEQKASIFLMGIYNYFFKFIFIHCYVFRCVENSGIITEVNAVTQ